jgi:glyoxylate/hydroxypyruvate reductase
VKSILPFVARLNDDDTRTWVNALSQAMPDEDVVPFAQLTDEQRNEARVAIVANPDPAELNQFPSLVWVQSLWAGVERMLKELNNPDIGIVRLEDPQLAASMAEAVLAWTLYLHRDMPAYASQQRAKVWRPLPFHLPSERRIALLGLGHLGERAAQTLLAAGFEVMGWSRTLKAIRGVKTFAGESGLGEMLPIADIVVCLLPLTDQTRGLLNAKTFAQMKPAAALINFGRGAIVNSADLVNALDRGALSHAVLDVFEVEPLPVESVLWSHEKVTVLPHISAPTHRGSASLVAAENIARYRADGIVPQTVDRKAGY